MIDYLQKTHHFYINKKLPEIEQSVHNLNRQAPGDALVQYLEVFFQNLKKDIITHLKEEEKYLFPYIMTLDKALKNEIDNDEAVNFMERFNITAFEANHDDTVENKILEVRRYIVQYCHSVKDLSPYRILLSQLDVFEEDLRVHGKVEDDILVPLGKKMEELIVLESSAKG